MMHRLLIGMVGFVFAAHAQAIEIGVPDDFEDGTTQGWQEGPPSPNPPVNVPDGGDAGAGDAYVSNLSAGGGSGSRQKMFNSAPQWLGNYLGIGVTHIRMNIANFSDEPVAIRVAFQRFKFYCFATEAVTVPAGGAWDSYDFSIAEEDITDVFSFSTTYGEAFSDIEEIIILAAEDPDCQGDNIDVTIGYDDIQAVSAAIGDLDEDGVTDDSDNCLEAANPGQEDEDGDGHGNRCDADFDQNCGTNFADLKLLADVFFTVNPLFDLDSSGGLVNFADLQIMSQLFFQEPGPSAPGALCNTP